MRGISGIILTSKAATDETNLYHLVKMQGGPCLSKKSKGVESCDGELVWHWSLGMEGREKSRYVLLVLMITIALPCILFFRSNARASN